MARLDLEIPATIGGGSLLEPLAPYSFPAYADTSAAERVT